MRKENSNWTSADGNVGALVRAMPRDELARLWQRRWRREPPKGISRRLLELNAAWLLQADEQGEHNAATRRRLEALAGSRQHNTEREESVVNAGLPAARKTLSAGSRLVRQWRGRSHVVEVVDGGFTYEGRQFTSLTAIAREITDTRWSGPRFFGLKAPASGQRLARQGREKPSGGSQHSSRAMPADGHNG